MKNKISIKWKTNLPILTHNMKYVNLVFSTQSRKCSICLYKPNTQASYTSIPINLSYILMLV